MSHIIDNVYVTWKLALILPRKKSGPPLENLPPITVTSHVKKNSLDKVRNPSNNSSQDKITEVAIEAIDF